MEADRLRSRSLDAAFIASTVAVVVLFGISILREARRPVHVEQRILPALGVVDRCETCHDPASHPAGAIASHPVERFGCTRLPFFVRTTCGADVTAVIRRSAEALAAMVAAV